MPSLSADLVEPAAVRLAWRPVESGDVRLEVDDRRPVHDVDSGEQDRVASDFQNLDQAEPDGVDASWPAGGEDPHPALLAPQQERNLPERRGSRRVSPGFVATSAATRSRSPRARPGHLGMVRRSPGCPVLGPVEPGLDGACSPALGVRAADEADHRQAGRSAPWVSMLSRLPAGERGGLPARLTTLT